MKQLAEMAPMIAPVIVALFAFMVIQRGLRKNTENLVTRVEFSATNAMLEEKIDRILETQKRQGKQLTAFYEVFTPSKSDEIFRR